MANRNYSRFQGLQKEVKYLEGNLVIGATGAVGTTLGLGLTSVTRTGTGAYTIKLEDPYNRLLGFHAFFSGTTASGIYSVQVNSATPQTDIKTGSGAIVYIQCLDGSGSDTDPAQTVLLHFSLILRNSTVGQASE